MVFTVTVNHRHLPVELFILQHDNITYFFIQVSLTLAVSFPGRRHRQ